jgi:hypothetical protein
MIDVHQKKRSDQFIIGGYGFPNTHPQNLIIIDNTIPLHNPHLTLPAAIA